MKRFVLIIVALTFMGYVFAQKPLVTAGKALIIGGFRASMQSETAIRQCQIQQESRLRQTTPSIRSITPFQDTRLQSTIRMNEALRAMVIKPLVGLSMPQTQEVYSDTSKAYANHILDRFLSYVRIESQSVYVEDPDSFPMTDGQRQIAQYIYDELKSICKGKKIEIQMSPDYYIYVKVPSNIKKEVPSIMFMAHMDVTPEANGTGINPHVHYNYDGGDIALGNGLVLSPNKPEGRHLKDLIGKTIITSDGSTLLGADCKTGCAILVTLIEQIVNDRKFKHGDVYFCFGQNEDIGKVQDRMDMSYFDKVPNILIDVDGGDYGEFSKSNFTAEMRSYYFKGNQVHPSHAKEFKFADARTAMSYFIGQLSPEIHPSCSEGRQGYVQCYMMDIMLPSEKDAHDARIGFRIRYFDKGDGERYRAELDEAYRKTQKAFPFVEISLESDDLIYENVAYNMHPKAIEVIEKAVEKTGILMKGVDLRAGTTSALMVAKGLPGGPCIYSGQQAEHSVYEWCCLEEMIEIVRLTRNIVTEVSKLDNQ